MGRTPDRSELLPGTLEMLILKTLSLGAMHGYGIAQHIQQISQDVLQVEEGSLYPALQRMQLKGWVTSEWGQTPTKRRARYYKLTPLGNVAIKVMTVPEGGTIYEDHSLKGPDRTTIEAPYGTRARYRCRRRGYTEGEVSVVFDGKHEVAVCEMKRIANCVDGTKNPFDDCPDARPD